MLGAVGRVSNNAEIVEACSSPRQPPQDKRAGWPAEPELLTMVQLLICCSHASPDSAPSCDHQDSYKDGAATTNRRPTALRPGGRVD